MQNYRFLKIPDAYYFRSIRRPELEITEYIDFGIVVSKCRVETREIFIFNRGALEGTFHICCCDNQLLTLDPSSGKVPPRSAQCIKVGGHYVNSLGIFESKTLTFVFVAVQYSSDIFSFLEACFTA